MTRNIFEWRRGESLAQARRGGGGAHWRRWRPLAAAVAPTGGGTKRGVAL